jgi:hypothetical protein
MSSPKAKSHATHQSQCSRPGGRGHLLHLARLRPDSAEAQPALERVAFMLWTMAGHIGGEEFALTPTDAEINLA